MSTKCINCPLHKSDLFSKASDEHRRQTQQFKSGEFLVDAGTILMTEETEVPQLYTVLRGMGVRYKTLPNGERQVINFVFPGDFIGLQAGVTGEVHHTVESSTSMTLCVFDRTELFDFAIKHPKRGFDLTTLASLEERGLSDALTTVGRRTAFEAIAWALYRLFRRGEALGMVKGHHMPLPFRQQDLADALGLSLVHTNKTLSKLKTQKLATWSDGKLHVPDLQALAQAAQTEHEPPEPRPLI